MGISKTYKTSKQLRPYNMSFMRVFEKGLSLVSGRPSPEEYIRYISYTFLDRRFCNKFILIWEFPAKTASSHDVILLQETSLNQTPKFEFPLKWVSDNLLKAASIRRLHTEYLTADYQRTRKKFLIANRFSGRFSKNLYLNSLASPV